MQDLFAKYWQNADLTPLIQSLRSVIFQLGPGVDDSSQQDASETFVWLKGQSAELLQENEPKEDQVAQRRSTTCLNCESTTESAVTHEHMLFLPLKAYHTTEGAKKKVSLDRLLAKELNAKPATVEYACDHCGRTTTASTRTKYTLPPHLDLGLHRTKYSRERGNLVKVNALVPITEQVVTDQGEYEVVGMVIHKGQATSGHYLALVKENGTWVQYNDDQVSTMEWQMCAKMFEQNGYMISLRRKTTGS